LDGTHQPIVIDPDVVCQVDTLFVHAVHVVDLTVIAQIIQEQCGVECPSRQFRADADRCLLIFAGSEAQTHIKLARPIAVKRRATFPISEGQRS
jgi:hypothetical protein